jgi:hypothetical protein
MNNVAQTYIRKPKQIQAALLSASNATAIANWCGGEVTELTKSGDPTDIHLALKVPNLGGTLRATVGTYVVRDEDGRFWVRTEKELLDEFETPTRNRTEELKNAQEMGILPTVSTPHYVSRGAYDRG